MPDFRVMRVDCCLTPLQNPVAAKRIGEDNDVSRFVECADLGAIFLRPVGHAIKVFDVKHNRYVRNAEVRCQQ